MTASQRWKITANCEEGQGKGQNETGRKEDNGRVCKNMENVGKAGKATRVDEAGENEKGKGGERNKRETVRAAPPLVFDFFQLLAVLEVYPQVHKSWFTIESRGQTGAT